MSSVSSVPSVSMTDASFDWDGFYVGLGMNIGDWSGITADMPRLEAGYNHTLGENFVVSLEASVAQGWLSAGWSAFEGELDVRAGVAFDRVLLYVSGGVGYYCMRPSLFAKGGGGIEIAVTDNISLDLEYQYWESTALKEVGQHVGLTTAWHF